MSSNLDRQIAQLPCLHRSVEYARARFGRDGSIVYDRFDTLQQAEAETDAKAQWLASLNEATRREYTADSFAVMSREVWILADGTNVIRPWQQLRAGNPGKG